jgi:F-type H+-transporting ATPase subunit gamma
METIDSLKRRIGSTEDLQSVVKTMKALAAVSIRQYEQAVAALEQYNRTIEMGLQIVLKNQPPQPYSPPQRQPRTGFVVFGSEQGLVGQFNERIASFALDHIQRLNLAAADRQVVTVGLRVATPLENAGEEIETSFLVPTSIQGITPLVQELVFHIEHWRAELGITRVILYYNRTLSAATYEPHRLQLLPVAPAWIRRLRQEPWHTNMLPTTGMDWDLLFSALIRQYLFVSLYRASTESLAGENASRLASMQAAERNIEERLDELHMRYHQQRQDAITEELMDIVSGFEALKE